jgi:hypothetical protein
MSPKDGFLPLAGERRTGHPRYMYWVAGFAHRVHHVFSEINYANKRVTALILSYGPAESDVAPDTYAEFLLRSRAVILHEPTAGKRGAGRRVR